MLLQKLRCCTEPAPPRIEKKHQGLSQVTTDERPTPSRPQHNDSCGTDPQVKPVSLASTKRCILALRSVLLATPAKSGPSQRRLKQACAAQSLRSHALSSSNLQLMLLQLLRLNSPLQLHSGMTIASGATHPSVQEGSHSAVTRACHAYQQLCRQWVVTAPATAALHSYNSESKSVSAAKSAS